MKTCTRCGVLKGLEGFRPRNSGWESWCRTCTKAYQDQYRATHREELRAAARAYWAAHGDIQGPKNRERWAANKERYSATNQRWMAANRSSMLVYYRNRGREHRSFLEPLKAEPCCDCGRQFPPFVMEFDHVRDAKRFAIGKMANHASEAVVTELAKCQLICCACHRVRTQARRGESKNPKVQAFHQWLLPLKQHPCLDCGASLAPVAMDFDHVRGEKIRGIAQMWSWGRDKVLAEIAKCELVCANCHRFRTQRRRHDADAQTPVSQVGQQ